MAIIKSIENIKGKDVTILIENNDPEITSPRRQNTRSPSNIIDKLTEVTSGFNSGVELVKHCAEQLVDGVQNLDDKYKPDNIEVKLAIKLGSEAGAVLVNVSGEAQMQVTLKWNLKQEG